MNISLRPIDLDADVARLVEIFNSVGPEPTTIEQQYERRNTADPGEIKQELVAVDADGVIVGASYIGRSPWVQPGRFWTGLIVAPEARSEGVGTALFTAVESWAAVQQATRLTGQVRDHEPAWLQWAERRGFRMDRHIFESSLPLGDFDAAPFAGVVERVAAGGIRFFTLADTAHDEAAQRRFYELHSATMADVPGFDLPPKPFAQFQREYFGASWYRPDIQVVAAADDEWVGVGAMGYFPHNNNMYHMMTGVRPAFRGRQIALAIKLLTLEAARRYSVGYVRTNNDAHNAPMLTINRKMGYVPQPGKYQVVREMQGDDAPQV